MSTAILAATCGAIALIGVIGGLRAYLKICALSKAESLRHAKENQKGES